MYLLLQLHWKLNNGACWVHIEDNPKYSIEDVKKEIQHMQLPWGKSTLVNKETGEVKEQEIFMGDF